MKKIILSFLVFLLPLIFLYQFVFGAEILVMAHDNTHASPTIDRSGSYKRGYPVVVFEDGHGWGAGEGLPDFVIIKIPTISADKVKKYIAPYFSSTPDAEGNYPIYQRRLWQIQWNSLPTAAKNKLSTTGQLIIKAGSYNGSYDFTWAQVKGYFLNLQTSQVETGDLQ